MNETGRSAPAADRAGPDHEPPGTGLPGRRRDRGTATRRRPWRSRARLLAAAIVVVAGTALTAVLVTRSGGGAPSPLTAVTGALSKTSAASYSFRVETTMRFAGQRLRTVVVSGTFDPRRKRGAERLTVHSARPTAAVRIRFLGPYVYTWVSSQSGLGTIARPWDKAPVLPRRMAVLPAGELYGFSSDQPVRPTELLGVLNYPATVRARGAASARGRAGTRYAFTGHPSAGTSVSGTVVVDRQGQVRRFATTTTQGRLTTTRSLTFGHFGAPVPVTAPAAGQVTSTVRPYWGFYF